MADNNGFVTDDTDVSFRQPSTPRRYKENTEKAILNDGLSGNNDNRSNPSEGEKTSIGLPHEHENSIISSKHSSNQVARKGSSKQIENSNFSSENDDQQLNRVYSQPEREAKDSTAEERRSDVNENQPVEPPDDKLSYDAENELPKYADGLNGSQDSLKNNTTRNSSYLDTEANEENIETRWLSGRLYQVAVVMMMAVGTFSAGSALAYPSVILPDIATDNTTLFGSTISFTSAQQDMLGSMSSLGAVFGITFCAVCSKRIGKINIMRIITSLGVLAWIVVGIAPKSWMILICRVFGGAMNGGVTVIGMTYVVEISDTVTRGPLTMASSISLFAGQALSVVPAYWLRYYEVAFVNCAYPIVFLFFATFLMPPSPSVLVLSGRKDQARKYLLRLRKKGADIEAEIKSYEDMNEEFENAKFRSLFKNRVFVKKFAIVLALFTAQVFSGYPVFSVQTARVLRDSGSTVDPTTATLMVQMSQVVGVVIALFSVRWLGRRGGLIISEITMCVSVSLLAVYVLWDQQETTDLLTDLTTMSPDNSTLQYTSTTLEEDLGWVPVACLMGAQLGASFGLQSIPIILASEYFPTSIRPQVSSISVILASLLRLFILQMYSPIQDVLTHVGLLFVYAAISLLAIPFTFVYTKETVGQSVG